MAEKYVLRITAGSDYDIANHIEVPVNQPGPLHIKGEAADIDLNVRIQNYEGLPRNSPATSPYFSTEPHASSQDQYSISFNFTPHQPPNGAPETSAAEGEVDGIKGTNLQFGNDFDRPIRDKLPPGFNKAMSIVKWWIDPGLDGDAYADKPHLYGPALSSFNLMHVGPAAFDEAKGGLWLEEGGDEEGLKKRSAAGMPDDGAARMKWGLKDRHKEEWVFEYGKTYGFDFFNPYLDFSSLSLKLPGFHLPIIKYWDGQGLRYVLRNKESGRIYLVVLFTLYLKADVNDDGSLKEGADKYATAADAHENPDQEKSDLEDHDESKSLTEAKEKLGATHEERQTSADDVD